MANQNVVDELVVRLTLDSESYQDAQAEVDARASGTEKKEKNKEAQRKARERDQSSRMKGLTSTAKNLGVALAAVAGFVAAIGAAVVGSITGLNTFEVGLRRQGVATGLSNREMQAWGSTARRLGADADAGASAIADLAREQKNFNLTGDAPTLQAFARLGIRAGTDTPIQDILAQAQQQYRNAPTGQKQQIESVLSSSGVSADLIVMIKSEVNARDAYNKSLQQATAENNKALDAFNDAWSSAKDNGISVANSLATVLEPGIKSAAEWFGKVATDASRFSERVVAAGGGVDGFMKVLNEESPKTATALQNLANVIDVVRFGFKKIGEVFDEFATGSDSWMARFSKKIDTEVAKTDHNPFYGILKSIGDAGNKGDAWVRSLWNGAVDNAHADGINTLSNATLTSSPSASATPATAQSVMGQLISKYGLSVSDAAAITANLDAESGLRPNAYNSEGGGQGARGLAQWRGDRIDAFRKRYGMNPDAASIDQQLEFMMTDPYERALLTKALAQGGAGATAGERGVAVSRTYEAHGNLAEDNLRGYAAAKLAAQYGGIGGAPAAAGNGVTITGPVTVVANNPAELVGGLQRVSSTQNQTSAVR